MSEGFASFREFYPFYLGEHRDRTCRRLHFVGTSFALGFIVLAMVAGLRQSRVAAAVPAVEALRTVPGASVRRRRVGRWIGAFLLALLIAGIAASTFVMAPQLGVDSGDVVLQSSLICMLLTGSLLSMCAPLTVGLLTRAWTALEMQTRIS